MCLFANKVFTKPIKLQKCAKELNGSKDSLPFFTPTQRYIVPDDGILFPSRPTRRKFKIKAKEETLQIDGGVIHAYWACSPGMTSDHVAYAFNVLAVDDRESKMCARELVAEALYIPDCDMDLNRRKELTALLEACLKNKRKKVPDWRTLRVKQQKAKRE